MNKLKTIVKVLDEKLAEDIVVIDMSIDKEGFYVKNIESRKNSKWILMDYGDIIVHLFDPEERKNYGIEKLWSDKPVVQVEDIL